MSRIYFLLFTLLLCYSKALLANQPNIIFILSDDQSFNTLANLGNNEIVTPNLDKLARRGVTFANAHNMGGWNGAVCLASRAMLNSGRSLWQAYKLEGKNAFQQRLSTSWAKIMRDNGYQTYMTGKWHVHLDAKVVFDHSKHIRQGMPADNWNFHQMVNNFAKLQQGELMHYAEFMPVGYNRPLQGVTDRWSPTDTRHQGYYAGGQHWSEIVAQDAIEFIQHSNSSNKPVFMYLAFNAPHDPRQAPQPFQDLYPFDELSLPANWAKGYPYAYEIGNGPSLRDSALAPFPRTAHAIRTHKKEYYALISHMDAQIGKILDALEANEQLDNTYIIFTSDHGLSVGERGLFGKQNMYEESIKAPFIVVGPNIPQGQINQQNIYIQDAMATTLELAQITKPQHVFFNSVMPLIQDTKLPSFYPSIYGAYVDSQRMIKADGYKLIIYPKAQVARLYYLPDDPLEQYDLFKQPAYQKIVKKLMNQLVRMQGQLGDELNLTVSF
ncbi:sulfatase [Catenovulum agarivorans DS-2]|uniref:Sulfatase n=1 Tax=Catenovulum agarivorans DS-2 TaxID=1328313 RepID=W7QWJ9_9ALTE|nr:sulfatase-like hydrolase/transferase [Catenovulum agarivorans]EWH12108.1 sulfatase [Catenovulum agarivorans DS-2]